jgi:hypothetical protein
MPTVVPGKTLDEFDRTKDHARRKPFRDSTLAEVVAVLSEVTDRLKTIEQQRSRLGTESHGRLSAHNAAYRPVLMRRFESCRPSASSPTRASGYATWWIGEPSRRKYLLSCSRSLIRTSVSESKGRSRLMRVCGASHAEPGIPVCTTPQAQTA